MRRTPLLSLTRSQASILQRIPRQLVGVITYMPEFLAIGASGSVIASTLIAVICWTATIMLAGRCALQRLRTWTLGCGFGISSAADPHSK
ncbi:unnamed protein product [Linum trigynum]|uniref:Uncharacterized protein n=1 Tax=Linum trigynum TaxID=586398 RepID=A0AAV2CGX8_9ROSI